MRIDILTLFPEMFAGPLDHSIVGRAREQRLVDIAIHDIRDWAPDRHHVVDDYPYGGGPGMVLKPEPVFAAVEAVQGMASPSGTVVLLTPQGRVLTQALVRELAGRPRLLILCGHYEGFDERVRKHLADIEVSAGDYVLSGGEPAAMALADAVVRLLPGALGGETSATEESHAQGLLEYPHYTRPPRYRGWTVPDLLRSGHHGEVARWRRRQSVLRTALRRPDLLARARLSDEDRRLLEEDLRALDSGA